MATLPIVATIKYYNTDDFSDEPDVHNKYYVPV